MTGTQISHIKRFLAKFLILVLLLYVADQIVGYALKKAYFNQKSGLNYRTTYVIDSTKADILIFGSSRANHHYIPSLIEDSLQLTCYNAGRDGCFLLYSATVFKTVLKRHKPKIVIFDVNYNELEYNKEQLDRISVLNPYYYKSNDIQQLIQMRSPFEKYKLVSAIYPYNSMLLTIVVGNMEMNKTRKADLKGYIPLYKVMQDTEKHSIHSNNPKLDSVKINLLTSVIKQCKEKGVRMVLVQSPIYLKSKPKESDNKLAQIARENAVEYYDFSMDTMFSKPALYQDYDHLNETGAKIFTKQIIEKIKVSQSTLSENIN